MLKPMSIGVPYVQGSDTSQAAAESLSGDLNRLEAQVYSVVFDNGQAGATDDEIEAFTGLSHQTVSARRRTLVLKKRLRDSGKRRSTRSGRLAVVWIVGADETVFEADATTKKVSRPSEESLKKAVAEIRTLVGQARATGYVPSDDLQKLGIWLISLTRTG